ncbi:MAG: hypothetical protein LLG04_01870 [Parachlamydia sp.]|nr:hypothetical protein [Parachlamydia sp.]
MHLLKWLKIFVAMALCFQTQGTAVTLVSDQMIWNADPYSAFTDLIYFQNQFFCCFRESNSHQEGENGKIRILNSTDASSWNSVALLALDGYDLRDPKLSVTPDGQLLLNMGATVWQGSQETINSAVSFSSDGLSWQTVQVLPYPGEWMWRVTWNQGKAYTGAYSSNGTVTALKLMVSTDGINYDVLKTFNLSESPTEATLRFLPDQTMVALVRRNGGPGLIGSSPPPYTNWTWFNTKSVLGGPNFLILPDGWMWATSRQTSGSDESTILALMNLILYDPLLTLPSGGDCSYPGMVYLDGKLYISYYSSQTGQTCIYLAVVQL